MAPGIIMSAILCFAPAAGTNRAPSVGEFVQKSAQVTDADRKAYPEYDFNETDRESTVRRRPMRCTGGCEE